MTGREISENGEKEAIRRCLLASMLLSANSSGFNGPPGRWTRFWQEMFKNCRMP